MLSVKSIFKRDNLWPWVGTLVVVILSAIQLARQGRLWSCDCGYVLLWAGNTLSSDNSQHIADPYTFTHILHGFVFLWVLNWIGSLLNLEWLSFEWKLFAATLVEALWEVVENTEMIIDRYREATAALGYFGDTILNSVADIVFCGLGVFIARALGFRRSLILFILVEVVLILWIKDSLILNVIMLIYPLDALREWQLG